MKRQSHVSQTIIKYSNMKVCQRPNKVSNFVSCLPQVLKPKQIEWYPGSECDFDYWNKL